MLIQGLIQRISWDLVWEKINLREKMKDCQSSVFRFVAVVGQRIVVLELKLVFIPSN